MAKRTPLYDTHVRLKGQIVEFAGYDLPIQYDGHGLMAEHNATRNNAGLFDVSHMGEIILSGKGSRASVNNLVTTEIGNLTDGEVKYSLMLNDKGTIIDDLLVYCINDEKWLLVVNACNCDKDYQWISTHLLKDTKCENISERVGQVAIQGPKAVEIMLKLIGTNNIPHKYYTFVINNSLGFKALISRTGYTGEDGFEIYADANEIVGLYDRIMQAGQKYGIVPAGLGCRDTLRFEACLPLYGHELSEDYYGHEVTLGMFVKMDKEKFIGKNALANTPAKFKRKAVKLIDRGIARENCLVYDANGNQIGIVTTGTYSPTLNHAIAMVRINKDYELDELFIDVRGRKLRSEIVKMPFYKRSGV